MFKMAGFKNLSKLILIFFLIPVITDLSASTAVYIYKGKIDSIRKDSIITIITDETLNDTGFYILEDKKKVAEFSILSIAPLGKKFKIIAELKITDKKFKIRAGQEIGFVTLNVSSKLEYPDFLRKDETEYKQNIISKIDTREMVLINKGKTLIGNNGPVNDEYPQHEIYLDDYYMDKYEVSNSDYLKFVKVTGSAAPRSWNDISFAEKNPDLPVLVSYYEAEKYAKWAGKRLPSENEWEKAGSGNSKYEQIKVSDGYYELLRTTRFPWGNQVNEDFSNSREYSKKNNINPGLMPIKSFAKQNISAFGTINMSGNAPEWTSSWYDSYQNNRMNNPLFGKKLKVIKGGGWFDSIIDQTIQKRAYGGIPNLTEDNIAGFRCMKIPDYDDISPKDYSLSR
ncbi:MAG: SUMF1/EgtB/PvdO family nonheme iron enzyme [Spirochaetes bacterium]|nr:SUMF1/EgtB/PvdO family nonheme iron enzyme [Spirochaetota bacterium]